MGATSKTFVDNNPPQVEAADLNGLNLEQKNLIEDSGQVFSAADQEQQSKAASNFAANGNFYGDSGAADAYILTPIGNAKGITAYANGQRFRFKAANTNTGASMVVVNGLSAKNIKDKDGTDLIAADIIEDELIEIIYDSIGGYFKLITYGLIGEIKSYGGSTAPAGYLLCDASAISRTTYASLFARIGTSFGVGDGSTTFNLPDGREAYLVGVGTRGSGVTAHDAFTLGQFKDDQMQGHKHGSVAEFTVAGGGGAAVSVLATFNATTGVPVSDGTNGTPRTGTVTRGKGLGVNLIIKY